MENDYKRTGRNIRAIRNANQIKLGDFAQNLGLSESLLSKIESGARPASDDLLFRIANKTGISFSMIKYGDLSELENGVFAFEGPITIDKISDNLDGIIQQFLAFFFPIVEDEISLTIDDFATGVRLVKEMIDSLEFTKNGLINAVSSFVMASVHKECFDYSHINILSCLGYMYVFIYKATGLKKQKKHLYSKGINSLWDFFNEFNPNMDEKTVADRKKEFLDRYNSVLTLCMYQLAQSRDNADYAYYYLALRYLCGMMDESITLIDEKQMALFGESMLDSLRKMGNKYALAWHELQEED